MKKIAMAVAIMSCIAGCTKKGSTEQKSKWINPVVFLTDEEVTSGIIRDYWEKQGIKKGACPWESKNGKFGAENITYGSESEYIKRGRKGICYKEDISSEEYYRWKYEKYMWVERYRDMYFMDIAKKECKTKVGEKSYTDCEKHTYTEERLMHMIGIEEQLK